ncbi:MAG: cadherin domain-containing protein [Chloroflexota bacterium]|nr:cadherin domain-containing protein [Chloroflexota bacterium]
MPASRLNRFPTWFFPALVLLALAAVAGLLWLAPTDSARAQSEHTVAADWPLIPGGIEPGGSFRLLFVTSTTRDASSSDIGDYNAHVRSAAGGNASLEPFKDQFTALISTSAVDARDNTGTTGGGVSIQWLGGEKVADDYADLYDGDWDSVSGKTEGGSGYTGLVWTGGNKAGEKSGQRYAGAEEVRLGDLGDATLALSSPAAKASGEAYPLYALSPVITVAEPEPEPTPTPTPQPDEPEPTPTPTPTPPVEPELPQIASGPVVVSSPSAGDTYVKGETVEVSVTFSESVTVTGQPYLRLTVGERGRRARYVRSEANGTTLIFAYTVKGNDLDEDGVSVEANQLLLNGGSIADSDGNDAFLEHPALADQSGHKVNSSLEKAPAEGQRQRAANAAPQFASDSAARSVDENTPLGTSVGAAVAATDPDGDTLTYALSGSDAFAIDTTAGQISVVSAPDYETQASYALTVTVSDGKNAEGDVDASVDDAIAVTVSIVNVDEPGRVSLVSATDPPQAGSELSAVLLDPDAVLEGSIAWQWWRSPDGTTAQNVNVTNFDEIEGGTQATMLLTEADAGRWLRASASYADAFGAGKRARAQTTNPVASRTTRLDSPPEPQNAPTTQTVSSGWSFIPSGVSDNQSFRLLFVTSTSSTAESSDIATYNTIVQNLAAAVTDLAAFSDQFKVLASTATVAARDNTATTHTATNKGVPIYWVGGEKVADDYEDFYDGSWDSKAARNESGTSLSNSSTVTVWVGSSTNGTTSDGPLGDPTGAYFGTLGSGGPISSGTVGAVGNARPLYGLSPVITVENKRPAAPTALKTFPFDRGALLSWSDPGDKTIIRYEYRVKAGAGRYGAWTTMANTGAGSTRYALTNLNNGKTYTLQLRAVDRIRAGMASDEAKATPRVVVKCASQTTTGQKCGVAQDWALIPSNVSVGQSFRLMFLTKGIFPGGSQTHSDYNDHVRSHAARNPNLWILRDNFTAMASSVNDTLINNSRLASTHIGASDPIYWVNGPKVADNYADLFDSSWDHNPTSNTGRTTNWATHEDGTPADEDAFAFTGSYSTGARNDEFALGSSNTQTAIGYPNRRGQELNHGTHAKSDGARFYGISPVLYVLTGVDDIAVTSTGHDGGDAYRIGSVITVTFTFNAAITVTGTPTLQITVGSTEKTANCARKGDTGEDAKKLECSYTVVANDSDTDGIEVEAAKLTGTIKDAAQSDALLAYTALPAQAGHKVDGIKPVIQFPTTATAAKDTVTITITDAGTRVKKYGAIMVDGSSGADTDCDTVAEIPSVSLTTLPTAASPVNFRYVVPDDAAGKKVCVYAEDGVGNSRSALWDILILAEPSVDQPTGLTTKGANGAVTLSWNDQSSNTIITKWQYRFRVKSEPSGEYLIPWTDIPGSSKATTSFTVIGLSNCVTYEFTIRAVAGTILGAQTTPHVPGFPLMSGNLGKYVVAPNWGYLPEGLEPGDEFRLLFVTDGGTTASSTNIDDYNVFVYEAADKNFSLVNTNGARFSCQVRALITTVGGVTARDNTHTTGSGVPIYWLGGEKVADDYADFYDGSWDSYAGKTESGADYTGEVWTGSADNGLADQSGNEAGTSSVRHGSLSDSDPFTDGSAANTNEKPLYALSPVLRVAPWSYRFSGSMPNPTTEQGGTALAYGGGEYPKPLSPTVYAWRQLGVAEEGKEGTLTASTDAVTPEVGHVDADGYRYVHTPKINRYPDGVTGKKWRALLFRFPTAGLTDQQKDDLEWLLLRTSSPTQHWYTGGHQGQYVWPSGSKLRWLEIVKKGIEEKNLRSVPDFEVEWFGCTVEADGNFAIVSRTTLHREMENFD